MKLAEKLNSLCAAPDMFIYLTSMVTSAAPDTHVDEPAKQAVPMGSQLWDMGVHDRAEPVLWLNARATMSLADLYGPLAVGLLRPSVAPCEAN